MEYLLGANERWKICLLGEQAKDVIFNCWGSRLKMGYVFVGGADLRCNI